MSDIIVHIIELSAFFDSSYEMFERNYDNNIYLVHRGHDQHISYSPYLSVDNVISFNSTEDIIAFILDRKDDIRFLIFHMIWANYKQSILKRINGLIPVHGIIWGWEIYEDGFLFETLLPFTRRLVFRKALLKMTPVVAAKHWIKFKLGMIERNHSLHEKRLNHINQFNSISTLTSVEYKYLYDKYNVRPKYIPFKYTVPLFELKEAKREFKKNILVGNSSALTNNHLDMLKYIGNVERDTKVILPMNYGMNPIKEAIITRYRKKFGNKLYILDSFLSPGDYNNLLDSCHFVIMNQLRQQALGNIYAALFKGAKVFLNRSGILYLEFTKKGFIVFGIDEFRREYPTPLANNLAKLNRRLVNNERGKKAIDDGVKNLIKEYIN